MEYSMSVCTITYANMTWPKLTLQLSIRKWILIGCQTTNFLIIQKIKNAKIGDQSIFSDLSILHVFILSDVATKGTKKHKKDSYLIFTVYHLLS